MKTLTSLLVIALMGCAYPALASNCTGSQQDRCDQKCSGLGGPGLITIPYCSREMVVATGEDYTKCVCNIVYDPDFEPNAPISPDEWCLAYPADPACVIDLIWTHRPDGTFSAWWETVIPEVAPED